MVFFTKTLKVINLLVLAGLFFIVAGSIMEMAFDGDFSSPYNSGLLSFVLFFSLVFLVCAFTNYRSVRQYDNGVDWAGPEVYAANLITGGVVAYIFLEMVRRPEPLSVTLVAAYLAANVIHAALTRRG